MLGEQEKILYGKGYIVDELCGLTFKISSRSFYQINHEQCVALYNKALSLLPLDEHASIIDTYCGIGTIGMIASQKARTCHWRRKRIAKRLRMQRIIR